MRLTLPARAISIVVLACLWCSLIVLPLHAATTGLHVSGAQLVDSNNKPVVLHGVNRSGTEYMCSGNSTSSFDGPADQASVDAIKSWGANAVRVPLNEDCWLGINGIPQAMTAATYQQQIAGWVDLLTSNNLYVIVELHWSAPGGQQSTSAMPMPDADHSPAFWTSVASTFGPNQAVIFDLFNEPYPDSNQDTTAAWTCVHDGGSCPGVSFQAAGMQLLLNAVRSTGATNVVMSPGVQYTGTLTHWLDYRPNDPLGNIAASWHNYNFGSCTNTTCWQSEAGPVLAAVPLVTGEIGENDCAHGYVDGLMSWLDANAASYLAWAWDTYDCSSFPSLITSYSGAPTNYGVGVRNHLLSLTSATPVPTSTATVTAGATHTPTSAPTNTPQSTSTPVPPTPTSGPVQTGQWVNVTPANVNLTSSLDCSNFGTTSIQNDPARPSDYYADFNCQGIWKSTDFGQTWTGPINTGTLGPVVGDGAGGIEVFPGTTGHPLIFKANFRGGSQGGPGLWKSIDGGVNWVAITGLPPNPCTNQGDWGGPYVDPNDPNHILMIAHECTAIEQSIDGGATWASVPTNPGMAFSGSAFLFYINTGNAATERNTWLWISEGSGGFVGTWRTSNGGTTWTQVDKNEHVHGTDQIYQVGTSGTIFMPGVYSALGWGVLRSTDYGQTWTHVGGTGNEAVAFGTPNYVYAMNSTASGLGTTESANYELAHQPGLTWTAQPQPSGMTRGAAWSAVSNNGSNYVIVTANWGAGLWRYVEPNGGPVPTSTPVPVTTNTPVPTATPVSTSTSTPTPTPVPSTATPTSTVALTSTATTTPTATATLCRFRGNSGKCR